MPRLFRRKDKDIDDFFASQAAKDTDEYKERTHKILSIPFPLSFPFFATSIAMISSSVFFFINKLIYILLSRSIDPNFFFITTIKKHPYQFRNIGDIRWKYYIPGDFMEKGTLFFLIILGTGVLMLVLHKWMLFLYEKKSFAGVPRG